MERDYKKWLENEEAKKKQEQELGIAKELYLTEEEEVLKNSILRENLQERQNSSRAEQQQQQPETDDEDYDRKQKITRLKKGISDKIQQHPQLAKTGKFIRQKVGNFASNNPKLTQNYNTFKDRRNQEIARAKEQANKIKTKVKQKSAQLTKKAGQATARAASQASKIIVQGLIQASRWLLATTATAAVGAIGWMGCLVIIIIVIIAVAYQSCNDNIVASTFCEGISKIASGLSWLYNQF